MPPYSVDLSSSSLVHAKLILVGPEVETIDRISQQFRSLKQTEHVSLRTLCKDEIQRASPLGVSCDREIRKDQTISDANAVALMRRWYWSRKTSHGFVITDFPSNRAQALLFDEWLDARDESLTACVRIRASGAAQPEVQGSQFTDVARVDVAAWTMSGSPALTDLEAFFKARGTWVEIDASRAADDALATFAERIAPFVCDR